MKVTHTRRSLDATGWMKGHELLMKKVGLNSL